MKITSVSRIVSSSSKRQPSDLRFIRIASIGAVISSCPVDLPKRLSLLKSGRFLRRSDRLKQFEEATKRFTVHQDREYRGCDIVLPRGPTQATKPAQERALPETIRSSQAVRRGNQAIYGSSGSRV